MFLNFLCIWTNKEQVFFILYLPQSRNLDETSFSQICCKKVISNIFFSSFPGSQGVLTMFPLKFSMGSQFVPQHVPHSTSLLSHIVFACCCSHCCCPSIGTPMDFFSIKPLALLLVCSREQALMVGDQTLLTVFEILLYNQICSTVKLPS
jgi:hypothetical protein